MTLDELLAKVDFPTLTSVCLEDEENYLDSIPTVAYIDAHYSVEPEIIVGD